MVLANIPMVAACDPGVETLLFYVCIREGLRARLVIHYNNTTPVLATLNLVGCRELQSDL